MKIGIGYNTHLQQVSIVSISINTKHFKLIQYSFATVSMPSVLSFNEKSLPIGGSVASTNEMCSDGQSRGNLLSKFQVLSGLDYREMCICPSICLTTFLYILMCCQAVVSKMVSSIDIFLGIGIEVEVSNIVTSLVETL